MTKYLETPWSRRRLSIIRSVGTCVPLKFAINAPNTTAAETFSRRPRESTAAVNSISRNCAGQCHKKSRVDTTLCREFDSGEIVENFFRVWH